MSAIEVVGIPDSKLCKEITELVRDTELKLLFNHSSRVYYFGALTGLRRGLHFDRELLYAGAMFHDMGLTHEHSSQTERFEVDGANTARDFLKAHNIAQSDIDLVWTAIALHTTPGIPVHMHPVIALVTAGVEMDVLGIAYDEFPDSATRGRGCGLSSHAPFQGGHHPDLLRRDQTQARNHFRQCEGRRSGGQGSPLRAGKFLQRDPRLPLERLTRPRCAQCRTDEVRPQATMSSYFRSSAITLVCAAPGAEIHGELLRVGFEVAQSSVASTCLAIWIASKDYAPPAPRL